MGQNDNKNFILKCVTLSIGVVETFFFSGIVFGLNSLYSTMQDRGVFSSHCKVNATAINSTLNTTDNLSDNQDCNGQFAMYGYILLTTIITQALFGCVMGLFCDKFGRIKTKILTAVLFCIGCVCFGLAFSVANTMAFASALFWGMSSQGILIVNIPLAELFPHYQNIIISFISGCFDSSSVVFKLINLSAGAEILPADYSMYILGTGGLICLSLTAIFLYKRLHLDGRVSKRTEKCNGTDEELKNVELEEIRVPQDENNSEEIKIENTENYEVVSLVENEINKIYPTLKHVLKSPQFLMQLFFFIIIFFRFSFILAELSIQLTSHFPNNNKQINKLLSDSGWFFMCGVVISPLAGWIIDFSKNRKIKCFNKNPALVDPNNAKHIYLQLMKSFFVPLMICCFTNLLMSICLMIAKVSFVYITYVFITITRAFLFSINSAYLFQAFPKKYFGRLMGIAVLISGLFGMLQYPILNLNLNVINYILIATSSAAFIHPLLMIFNVYK